MTNFLKEKKTYKFFYSLRELQTADKSIKKKPLQIRLHTLLMPLK